MFRDTMNHIVHWKYRGLYSWVYLLVLIMCWITLNETLVRILGVLSLYLVVITTWKLSLFLEKLYTGDAWRT